MGATRRLLERIPGDRLAWRPHERSRSLGALATHVADLPRWADPILNAVTFDLAGGPPYAAERTSPVEILAMFEEAISKTRAWMDKTDAEYLTRWTLARGGHELFSMPRVSAFKALVVNHIVHHRGQLSVYLRMNDVPVPSIYGPSADEA